MIDEFKNMCKQSPFNRSGYEVHFDMYAMYRSLEFYHERMLSRNFSDGVKDSDANLIERMTPAFQRDADKWSLDRKISYVENTISGYKSEIMLYTTGKVMDDCFILDGLQRLTAWDDWFKNKFPIFGLFYYKDLIEYRRAPFIDCRMYIKIMKFETECQAVQFYIDINKGISHSPDDILRAEKYLKSIS